MRIFNAVGTKVFVNNDQGESKLCAEAHGGRCAEHIAKCLNYHDEVVSSLTEIKQDLQDSPDLLNDKKIGVIYLTVKNLLRKVGGL